MATDVLGRLVEVVSGQPLDEFFAERIFGPLGMADTSFGSRRADAIGSPPSTSRSPGTRKAVPGRRDRRSRSSATGLPVGGGGLVSTAADYHRFTQMLLRGGELDGVAAAQPAHRRAT